MDTQFMQARTGRKSDRVLDAARWALVVGLWLAVAWTLWQLLWVLAVIWLVPGWFIALNAAGFAILPIYTWMAALLGEPSELRTAALQAFVGNRSPSIKQKVLVAHRWKRLLDALRFTFALALWLSLAPAIWTISWGAGVVWLVVVGNVIFFLAALVPVYDLVDRRMGIRAELSGTSERMGARQ
jgi:hypothetical protein